MDKGDSAGDDEVALRDAALDMAHVLACKEVSEARAAAGRHID
jgi:hypothetical protein